MTFTRSTNGTGFALVEREGYEPDATFGIGRCGLPVCARCEGSIEMTLADDTLVPAAEAVRQVQEQLEPQQPQLFVTAKPFNFEDAWMDIARKQHEVDALRRIHQEDAEKARRSKKLLDEALETFGHMVNTYEARRVAKLRAALDAITQETAVPAHDAVSCAICSAEFPTIVLAALDAVNTAYTDLASEAHRLANVEAHRLQEQGALDLALVPHRVVRALRYDRVYGIPASVVESWSVADRRLALEWARAGAVREECPAVMRLPHLAGLRGPDGVQVCQDCVAPLAEPDDGRLMFPEGAYVGLGCPGQANAVEDVPGRGGEAIVESEGSEAGAEAVL